MNVENFKLVMQAIENAPPDSFDMSQSLNRAEEYDNFQLLKNGKCGAAGCVAGWAVALLANRREVDNCDVFDLAAEKLGLDEDESTYLFLGHFSPRRVDASRSEVLAEMRRMLMKAELHK